MSVALFDDLEDRARVPPLRRLVPLSVRLSSRAAEPRTDSLADETLATQSRKSGAAVL
jgi:hypothetical protein